MSIEGSIVEIGSSSYHVEVSKGLHGATDIDSVHATEIAAMRRCLSLYEKGEDCSVVRVNLCTVVQREIRVFMRR